MKSVHALHTTVLVRPRGPHPPRWHSRLAARLRGLKLDRELARGVPPWQSPVLAARAIQLTSDRRRRELARSLERLLERAERPSTRFANAVIEPCREQVHDARPVIRALISQLRSDRPLDVHGIARVQELMADGGGPCYAPLSPRALALALEDACQWLAVSD